MWLFDTVMHDQEPDARAILNLLFLTRLHDHLRSIPFELLDILLPLEADGPVSHHVTITDYPRRPSVLALI